MQINISSLKNYSCLLTSSDLNIIKNIGLVEILKTKMVLKIGIKKFKKNQTVEDLQVVRITHCAFINYINIRLLSPYCVVKISKSLLRAISLVICNHLINTNV